MEIEKIAGNLFRRQAGKYEIYELEGSEVSYVKGGERISFKVEKAERDVFARTFTLVGVGGARHEFREPTYMERDGGILKLYYLSEAAAEAQFEEAETTCRILELEVSPQ